MNSRITSLKKYVVDKQHIQFRQDIDETELADFTNSLKEQKLSDTQRTQARLSWVLEKEIPVILPEE